MAKPQRMEKEIVGELEAFIEQELNRPKLEAGEITVSALAVARGIGYRRATAILEGAVAAGVATRRTVVVRGHICTAYRTKK